MDKRIQENKKGVTVYGIYNYALNAIKKKGYEIPS